MDKRKLLMSAAIAGSLLVVGGASATDKKGAEKNVKMKAEKAKAKAKAKGGASGITAKPGEAYCMGANSCGGTCAYNGEKNDCAGHGCEKVADKDSAAAKKECEDKKGKYHVFKSAGN